MPAQGSAEQNWNAISRETLRKWLIKAELRRARYRELLEWDTSEHDWLAGRGEQLYMIAMIDGATSQLAIFPWQ